MQHQVEGNLSQASADGVYDSHGCHAAIAERDARAAIPPRDALLQAIETKGLAGWKNESGYHRRSIAENMK